MQVKPQTIATVDAPTLHSVRTRSLARQSIGGPPRSPMRPSAALGRSADYVTIPIAAAMTGYSVKAIRRKIEAGVWLEGREFRRAPDGHVLISVKGYELWVERGRG